MQFLGELGYGRRTECEWGFSVREVNGPVRRRLSRAVVPKALDASPGHS